MKLKTQSATVSMSKKAKFFKQIFNEAAYQTEEFFQKLQNQMFLAQQKQN